MTLFSTTLFGKPKPSTSSAFLSSFVPSLACALILAPMAFFAAAPAGASGSSGGGFSGGGRAPAPQPRVVDENYEFGKALYLGRAPGAKKVNYCVNVDGEPKKLRGRNLRGYKGVSQLDFANALVNCQQPDELALAGVRKEEIAYVIYYLDKRYKLNLQS